MKFQTTPEIEIIEVTESELEPLYRVIILNDDVTPMDFVVEILKVIFFLANERAAEIMLMAHIKGSAYVQSLPKPEAERRIQKAHAESAAKGFPLRFTMESE